MNFMPMMQTPTTLRKILADRNAGGRVFRAKHNEPLSLET